MLRNLLTWFLLLGSALAISACCANNECLCLDNDDNVVFFQFNLDPASSKSFTAQDVDTVFISRKPLHTPTTVKTDTIRLNRATTAAGNPITIGPNGPFTSSVLRFTKYQYTIWLPKRPERFVVDSLHVDGEFSDVNGCCTCFKSLNKDLRINGVEYKALDPDGQDKPVYLTLSKP